MITPSGTLTEVSSSWGLGHGVFDVVSEQGETGWSLWPDGGGGGGGGGWGEDYKALAHFPEIKGKEKLPWG